jgi:ATP-dependent DNA helicase RecG
VKGVGPRLGSIFKSREIETVKDLLTFFPRAYEDRSKLLRVADLRDGQNATVAVQVLGSRQMPTRTGRSILEVRAGDGSGTLSLKWFHAPRGMAQRFAQGTQIIVTGAVKFFMNRPEIVHPEISWGVSAGTDSAADYGRVVPIYVEIEGVPSKTFRKILWEALEKFAPVLTEDLPARCLEAHRLPRLAEAVRAIHFPPETVGSIEDLVAFNTPAHWRLVYEEFFKFEYLVLRQRLRMERQSAPPVDRARAARAVADLARGLPFELTADQRKAIDEILDDLAAAHPMNRLIQGDVGSGKTAVALLTAGAAQAEGGQVALMAPTEILAEQHYRSAVRLFGGKLNVALLMGKTPASERDRLQARLSAGEPTVVIGTHALIEDPVEFRNLVYVMVDEQHRFGVEQRRKLRGKGMRKDPTTGRVTLPHALVLTATPIPRTLALTAYGDLSVSTIQEMPKGRSPVVTHVVRGDARVLAYERIRDELKRGHQAYFIYPLVNDSEAEGFTSLKSAVAEADRLTHEVFPEFKVGLLHGQLRPDEKASVMERFQRGELNVLVSTTVVEVGVDVPNATVMAVEHAERFGLSQLHQLRGRVGRGGAQSYCYFFAAKRLGETTEQRLEVMEETNDGFRIAEADLEIRGPGEFLGTRQAGGLPFRLAHLVRDREWLLKARDDAQALLKEDPELTRPEHLPLRRYYEREGGLQFERLKTS